MSNTVITNYTDLNGPSTKADSSVVVIVNKDGSLSVDQNLLGTLIGTDGSQAAGISVVRVGHEGRPDDATDSESDDDKIPHVTLSVDSYYGEPNSIMKYDSGAEMLQSLRIETRENSLVGFQNDHCYTPLTSPSQSTPQHSENFPSYDDPVIEITHTPPPKPVPNTKKIAILDQQIIQKGKKITINPSESSVIFKGNDILPKPKNILSKSKQSLKGSEDSLESSSVSSSGDSIPDRDSDSDYKDARDKTGNIKSKRSKIKPRILKNSQSTKTSKLEQKPTPKSIKSLKREIREKVHVKAFEKKISEITSAKSKDVSSSETASTPNLDSLKKSTSRPLKKEKKTPARVTALLSDMSSLFSTPDIIRRVSTDNKLKSDKDATNRKISLGQKQETNEPKVENIEKNRSLLSTKTYSKEKREKSSDKISKPYDPIPQLDDVSLAQILQDTTPSVVKGHPAIAAATMSSPSLAGPLSPTLDLLGGLQPEEEGLTEDLLMHVAQLVESSENLQEVIDKQVLGKVDTAPAKTVVQSSPFQQAQASSTLYTTPKTIKTVLPRKDPIEIVRKDGRVITLPPIEAPATRSSKRKSQMETSTPQAEEIPVPTIPTPVLAVITTPPEPQVPPVSKQYINKKLTAKKLELVEQPPVMEKSAESQESWNSEDDPFRLWCICKQPHNNRFMICCDSCEDWFHGKCVNITKAMGQQMEEKGVEWRCPNCIKKTKHSTKNIAKDIEVAKKTPGEDKITSASISPISTKDTKLNTNCIVCKKAARASSIYCSDSCILKHAQDSLVVHTSPDKMGNESGKSQDKSKSDSRVIVYERKSGRLLAGPNAPTADNLKSWLQKNPTFEVVRPGTLSTIKPKIVKKKSFGEANKIQTTLNFDRIPKKPAGSSAESVKNAEIKQSSFKVLLSPKEESRPAPRTPVTSRPQNYQDTPRPSTSTARISNEQRKPQRATSTRSQSAYEKTPAVSPSTSRKKDTPESKSKMNSTEPIRENVRKALQEQMCKRMEETPESKFTQDEIRQFAIETEAELHDLFRDVGMKYKAKYRSLMFNIKDRKNLSLWQKICDHAITPKQLVRLSPEELASQELAQWRDKEAKYQLELIKKSELDLLAASKTYVLKTHKGEEVMETKESKSTELDRNVPVEDLVTALNDSAATELEQPSTETSETPPSTKKSQDLDKSRSNKKEKDSSRSSKKKNKESRRDSESRKSRSSRRRSEEKETRSTRRSEKQTRIRSDSKDRSKTGSTKDKSDSGERSRHRSPSRGKAKRRSKSREHSRSTSQNRDRSQSKERNKRTHSGEKESKRKRRSQLKHSTEDKIKLRSRSQETSYAKSKNDSTDSDSIERPKSAMMKDSHPAYDPHEPMITSAFSEEDLRKSGDDLYDSYKDLGEYKDDYDPSKSFTLDTSIILPTSQYTGPKEKASEAESDQEPSSTVEHPSATVWSGCINMVDVARFYVAAHEVSGLGSEVEEDLSTELDIVGRINPETVWDYISKMKRTSNKDIVILRLQAANDEEKMQYIALYSYLSSRNRLGVVKVTHPVMVKDIYIVPLPANTALPSVLFPLDGPGIGEVKTHLLLAIIIRQRKKRAASSIPKDVVPAKVSRERRKRSYTPPVAGDGSPASPRRRALPMPYASPALSSTVKSKIAASLAAADDEEAYSPGSSSSSGSNSAPAGDASNTTLRSKMEELNRQIEEQKQQILKMAQADSSVGEDEAYSPSRPMTPPEAVSNPLADISLPSNLQEILATIKQRSEPIADVDMRNLPLPP